MIEQLIKTSNFKKLSRHEQAFITGGNYYGNFFTSCAGRAFVRASIDFGAMGGGDSATFGTLLAEHMSEC